MLFLFLVTCLVNLVATQDMEWDNICVTDPLGRARLHLENNSPRPLIFGIDCSYCEYYYGDEDGYEFHCYEYYAEVYVQARTIYTQRVYFNWEDEGYEGYECLLDDVSLNNHFLEVVVIDAFADDPTEQYNYTWCTHRPGVEDGTQVYTDCKCDSEGFVTYHFVNNLNDEMYFQFGCVDIYYYDDLNYDYDYVSYEFEVDPRSRVELYMIHHDWNVKSVDSTCVLMVYEGFYELYYYVMDYYYGEYYYLDTMTFCHPRPLRTEPIAEVIPHCPSTKFGDPEIELRADIPAYAVVHCKNGQAHLSAVTQMSALIDGSFDQGDFDDACQFYKQDDVDVYSVTVEVGWGLRDRELFLDSKIYTISCVYEVYGESRSSVERVGSAYIAPEAINVFFGNRVSKGGFELRLLDVLDRQVHVRNLALGSLVRLMAFETVSGIHGYRAHTCSASNGITSYSILINGCGDGQILDKREGFYTDHHIVVSPYFQIFKLRGGANIWFDCIFVDCDGEHCDGSSCDFVGSSPAQVMDFDRFGEFGHSEDN